MGQPSVLAAIAVVILWPAGLALCTRKYLRAHRAGQKVDAWIWFFCWCVIISFVEWFALFGYWLIARMFGVHVEL